MAKEAIERKIEKMAGACCSSPGYQADPARSLERVVGVSGETRSISGEQPLSEAVALLESRPDAVGLLICDAAGRPTGLLNRTKLFQTLSQAFVRELYLRKPTRVFLADQDQTGVLVLDWRCSIEEAIRVAMQREPADRYGPLVVTDASNRHWVLDVRVLIEDQRKALQYAVEEVERRRREAQHAATHDRLTGLPNRAMLNRRLGEALGRRREDGTSTEPNTVAVLFLDFDRFKVINDSLGHDAGDALLIEIGRRLSGVMEALAGPRATDHQQGWTVGRQGGDEFLVVYPEPRNAADRPDADQIAEALRHAMDAPIALGDQAVTILPSIGVTDSLASGRDAAALLRDADVAMYRAKAEGGNCAVRFGPSMRRASVERLNLENELRTAIARGDIEPWYQPIVCCQTGTLAGFETLARWRDAERGLVSPGQFIPIAEETGLIVPMSERLADRALRDFASWRAGDAPDGLWLSVNVSKRHAIAPGFVDALEGSLDAHGVPAELLHLEVTESLVIDRPGAVVDALNRLKRRGVRLAMDDFGTGTSSLTSLHQLPFDMIKIDRAFLAQLEADESYAAIIHAIVSMARHLKMSVVAEGIETPQQLARLRELDCDHVQGFLFGKAVPADEVVKMLAASGGRGNFPRIAA